MLTKRLIPHFLLYKSRLVKGTNFKNFVDVGDPLSQSLIYDAQGAEELIMVDIMASGENRVVDILLIFALAARCRLPITIGGGIHTINDARRCFLSGADKIVLNTAAVTNPDLISKFVDKFGSANVVVSIDVRRIKKDHYEVYIFSGTRKITTDIIKLIKQIQYLGAGELIVTSITQEGTLSGFDCELYKKIRPYVTIPLIASGGASCYDDLVHIFQDRDCDAAALGKMLFLRDYDIVRIKSYLKGKKILVREA